ncbi:MAG: hypothetical protein HND48_23085 [Chloroflexi bacterium]|nr:hypothetical protein [Chloroflexota bacterium]
MEAPHETPDRCTPAAGRDRASSRRAAQIGCRYPDPRRRQLPPRRFSLFAAVRLDPGFLEQTTALLSRLKPFVDEIDVREAILDSLGPDAEPVIDAASWIGIGTTAADADISNLTDMDSRAAFLFGVRDRAALEPELAKLDLAVSEQRGDWTLYSIENSVFAALKDDLLIVSPDAGYIQSVLSGDYASLADAPAFTDVIARLPESAYDFAAYFDTAAMFAQAASMNRRELELPDAYLNALGSIAVAGVNRGGRDLLLDAAFTYGDLSGLEQYGLSSSLITGPAVDPAFMANLPANTQVVLHSRDLGGAINQMFEALNGLGAVMADMPGSERGLRDLPVRGERFGDALKAALNLGLTTTLGLDIDKDVIDLLNGDFALFASILPVRSPMRFAPSIGLITADGAAGALYVQAVTDAFESVGLPVTVTTTRGSAGTLLDLSPLTDPLLEAEFSPVAANDPAYDFAIAHNDSLLIVGSTPAAEFALAVRRRAAQHAGVSTLLESVLLPDAQFVGFINVPALSGIREIPGRVHRRVRKASVCPASVTTPDSAIASASRWRGRSEGSLRRQLSGSLTPSPFPLVGDGRG